MLVSVLILRRRREYQKLDISKLLTEQGIDSNQLMPRNQTENPSQPVSNYLPLEVMHVACILISWSILEVNFNVKVCSWLVIGCILVFIKFLCVTPDIRQWGVWLPYSRGMAGFRLWAGLQQPQTCSCQSPAADKRQHPTWYGAV